MVNVLIVKRHGMKVCEMDDEICMCGHSKGYHKAHELDKHGGACEKCDCRLYTWGKFVKYVDM